MPTRVAARTTLVMLSALALLAVLAACGGARPRSGGVAATRSAMIRCDRIAAPYGSDRYGRGTHRRPYRSIRRLDRSLRPGQTGCLRAGTYGGLHTWHLIATSGTPSQRITVRAYPGEHVKLIGWVELSGSYTTLSHFEIDGSNTFYSSSVMDGCQHHGISQGLSIEGVGDVFESNDLYQSVPALRSNGIGIGWSGSGTGTVIRYNRIHDVGQCRDFDQLIYVAHGQGIRIYDNWLWNDRHGWGVQIYPGAADARVYSNVIDGAGSGFTVGGDPSTSGNQIYHNVVLNSTGLRNASLRGVAISDYWPGAAGTGNVFVANDSYRNPAGIASVKAVRLSGNISVPPHFVRPSGHLYRLNGRSQLSSWQLWDGR